MNNEDKNQFDAILALQQMTWKRVNSRQGIEWKMSMAIWTVLSLFIGTAITGRISDWHSQWIIAFTVIGIVIICILYMINLIGIWKFLKHDSAMLNDYDGRLFKLCNITFSDKTADELEKTVNYYRFDWYVVVRIGITLVLMIGAILSVYIANPHK